MQEFLDLFDSEESVERDYLKNILHKLYAKVSVIYNLLPATFISLVVVVTCDMHVLNI